MAKIYLSVFPDEKKIDLFNDIKNEKSIIKHELSHKLKNQMRKQFHLQPGKGEKYGDCYKLDRSPK